MKKLFTLFAIAALTVSSFAQSPQKISYQAVVRNSSGVLMANQAIGMKISILHGAETGTPVYVETQTKTTNANGLVTLEIGIGTIVSGSFAGIDWSNGTYFIKTETDQAGGTNYTITGTSQILSVPFALYAKTAKTADYNYLTNKPTTLSGYGITDAVSVAGTQTISGETIFKGTTPDLEAPLFEVKNKDSQTIFAVYNEGVRIWVADGAKGTKGGFAVGGFDMKQNYLDVRADSTRIYVKNPAKGVIGGFAVGGFDMKKGPVNNYLALTPENYLIGENSGAKMTTGLFNSFMGYEAGKENTEGMSNVIIGHQAGTRNTIGGYNMFIGKNSGFFNINGERNIFLGDFSGYSNTGGVQTWMGSNNVFIGSNAGYGNTTGGQNIFIGTSAGSANSTGTLNIYIGHVAGYNSTGVRNTFIGSNSGENNTTGSDNIFIGNQTGQNSTIGTENTFIGSGAGMQNGSGSNNVFLGNSTGTNNNSGNYNVFLGSKVGLAQSNNRNIYIGYQAGTFANSEGNIMIGYQAGNSEINSNRLYIENSGTDKVNALIYGEFDTDLLMINAVVKIRDLLNVKPRPSAPANPEEGDVYYDSNYHKLMVYNGTDWMACW
jgi:hypothetical protein